MEIKDTGSAEITVKVDELPNWSKDKKIYKLLEKQWGPVQVSITKLQNGHLRVKLYHPTYGYRIVTMNLSDLNHKIDHTFKADWDLNELRLIVDGGLYDVARRELPLFQREQGKEE